jgi:hypothetical protein
MTNPKCQINSKAQMSKMFWILNFDIHLAFACLPCLLQAGAGRDFEI